MMGPEDGFNCALDCGDPACQAVDCSQFGDRTSCNAQAGCRWDNKAKVCVPN